MAYMPTYSNPINYLINSPDNKFPYDKLYIETRDLAVEMAEELGYI